MLRICEAERSKGTGGDYYSADLLGYLPEMKITVWAAGADQTLSLTDTISDLHTSSNIQLILFDCLK